MFQHFYPKPKVIVAIALTVSLGGMAVMYLLLFHGQAIWGYAGDSAYKKYPILFIVNLLQPIALEPFLGHHVSYASSVNLAGVKLPGELIHYFPYLLFGITVAWGGIQFQLSQFKQSSVLRFVAALVFVEVSVRLLLMPYRQLIYYGVIHSPGSYSPPVFDTGRAIWLITFIIMSLVILGFAFSLARYLPRALHIPYQEVKVGPTRLRDTAKTYIEVQPANRWIRLLDHAGDLLLAWILLSNLFTDPIFAGLFGWLDAFRNDGIQIQVMLLLTMLPYYYLSEGWLGYSPMKALTGCGIVNFRGEVPSTVTVLGRSLARWIPFNPLSFLFLKRGWHDTVSGTYVIRLQEAPSPLSPSKPVSDIVILRMPPTAPLPDEL